MYFQIIFSPYIDLLFSFVSRFLNSSSMLCDCQLEWFPEWINQAGHRTTVQAECAHPEALLGQDIFSVESRDFTCGKFTYTEKKSLCNGVISHGVPVAGIPVFCQSHTKAS